MEFQNQAALWIQEMLESEKSEPASPSMGESDGFDAELFDQSLNQSGKQPAERTSDR